jgi:hypothetical protein
MTSNGGPERTPVYSLQHVLDHFPEVDAATRGRMYESLVNREDAMAEIMFLAGMQFGLFPQIVAEVLAEVGLGTPKSDGEREMIRASFVNLMEQLRRAQSGEGPMPQP